MGTSLVSKVHSTSWFVFGKSSSYKKKENPIKMNKVDRFDNKPGNGDEEVLIFETEETLPPVRMVVEGRPDDPEWLLVTRERASVCSFHSFSASPRTLISQRFVNGREEDAGSGEPCRLENDFFRYSRPVGPFRSGSKSFKRDLLISFFRICK